MIQNKSDSLFLTLTDEFLKSSLPFLPIRTPHFRQCFYLFWNTKQSTSIVLSSSFLGEWLTELGLQSPGANVGIHRNFLLFWIAPPPTHTQWQSECRECTGGGGWVEGDSLGYLTSEMSFKVSDLKVYPLPNPWCSVSPRFLGSVLAPVSHSIRKKNCLLVFRL